MSYLRARLAEKAGISICSKARSAAAYEDDYSDALREQVERKKVAIGWVDDEANTAALRHAGLARTPAKRELLARIERRAKASGRKPLSSSY